MSGMTPGPWNFTETQRRQFREAHVEATRRSTMRSELWQCEDCGWTWPLKDVPYQDTECDACGGTMVKVPA